MPNVDAFSDVQMNFFVVRNVSCDFFNEPERSIIDLAVLSLSPDIFPKLSILYNKFSKVFLDPSIINVASSAKAVFLISLS